MKSELIYIAAPLFSEEQVQLIKVIENYLDMTEQKYFTPREYGSIAGEKMTPERMTRIFDMNIRMLSECETIIAVTDDFDPGTIFEIGMAHAMDINIITYSSKGYGSNVMIAKAAFTHCQSIEDLATALNGHKVYDLEVTE